MSFEVVTGLVLAFVGSFLVQRRARINVHLSTNPARSAVRYALSTGCYALGLGLIAWFSRCAHLSAWLIGAGAMAVTVAASIVSWGWGYRIPELHPVAAGVMGAFLVMLIVAWLRPGC